MPDCLPSRFECQSDKLKRTAPPYIKRNHFGGKKKKQELPKSQVIAVSEKVSLDKSSLTILFEY